MLPTTDKTDDKELEAQLREIFAHHKSNAKPSTELRAKVLAKAAKIPSVAIPSPYSPSLLTPFTFKLATALATILVVIGVMSTAHTANAPEITPSSMISTPETKPAPNGDNGNEPIAIKPSQNSVTAPVHEPELTIAERNAEIDSALDEESLDSEMDIPETDWDSPDPTLGTNQGKTDRA